MLRYLLVMGTQNLNNYYFNKVGTKISYDSYYDIFLASDEKDYNMDVVYSTNIVDHINEDTLPVWIDLNSSASTAQPNLGCESLGGELISNGTFTNWVTTTQPVSWVMGGTVNITNYIERDGINDIVHIVSDSTQQVSIKQSSILQVNKKYKVSIEITEVNSGAIFLPGSLLLSSVGVHEFEFVSLNSFITVTNILAITDIKFTNISVKEVLDIPQTIISKNKWTKAKSHCECPYTANSFTICNIVYTGTDNGLIRPTLLGEWSGNCINLYDTVPTTDIFSATSFDKRFKMSKVKPNNTYGTDMSILSATDYSGYYQELKGGFYQGFYKLYGYPYEVLPTRPEKGWSFETYLKLNTIGDDIHGPDEPILKHGVYGNCYNTSGFNIFKDGTLPAIVGISATTLCSESISAITSAIPSKILNYTTVQPGGLSVGRTDKYGFFFYKGIRAEDKYHINNTASTIATSLSDCTTFTASTGTGNTPFNSKCCDVKEDGVKLVGANESPNAEYDVYSNAIGFRITDDMKIGYRAIRYTGTCQTTGSTCDSGKTFTCGYSIEENYSSSICEFITKSGNCQNTWIQVDVVFERNLSLDDCEIYNNGGVNDLIKVKEKPGTYGNQPKKTKPCKGDYPRFVEDAYFDWNCHGSQVENWFTEREYRLGTLTFYVNGRRFHTVEDFEEIIPKQLNTNKETQVGVAYNMSWGGGALGLRENFYPSNCDVTGPLSSYYPEPDQKLIMENFAGSFIGGISQMMYYIKPLTPDEIYHNFKINKGRYGLVDCEECKNCNKGCTDCLPYIYGCTDPTALNYNPLANYDDGSCTYQMTYVPDSEFRITLFLQFGILFDANNETQTSNVNTITSLNVSARGIYDMTGIEDFTGLTNLDVGGNNITSINVSSNTALSWLNCYGNQLTNLDVVNNIVLTYLNCSNNQITSLDVSNNTALTDLRCYGNQLTSLDVSDNIVLTYLNCKNNQLTSLDLRNGNNINMPGSDVVTLNNMGLLSINVDDPAWATINWPLSIGDANHDGIVNNDDLTLVLVNVGQTVTPWTNGDVNGDGIVNNADLTLVTNNWLNTANVDAWTTFIA